MRKVEFAVGLVMALSGFGMAQAQSLPAGPGRNVVVSKCSGCHAAAVFQAERHDADGWDETVDKMVDRGLMISDPERSQVVAYLAKAYGPAAKPAAAGTPAKPVAKVVAKPAMKPAAKPKPKT